jgi:hypothetical protein
MKNLPFNLLAESGVPFGGDFSRDIPREINWALSVPAPRQRGVASKIRGCALVPGRSSGTQISFRSVPQVVPHTPFDFFFAFAAFASN